jgi:hypothetical protein
MITQLSANPYAAGPIDPFAVPPTPPRTSWLAISAMICSCICCIPGLSALGTLLGVAGLFRISTSNGRRTGMGLAIAAIIVGIAISVVWIVVLIGANSVIKQVASIGTTVSTSLQAPTPDELTKNAPFLAGKITPAQWATFKSEVESELGTLQPIPTSWVEFFSGYSKVGPILQGRQFQNEFPMPLPGSKAWGAAIIHMDTKGGNAPSPNQPGFGALMLSMADNISVLTPSGKQIWLIDPVTTKPPLPAPTTPDAPVPPKTLPAPATP